MGVSPAPLLLDGGPEGLLVGHVAVAAGPARVAVLRTGGLPLFSGRTGWPEARWPSPPLGMLGDREPRHDAAACATAAGIHHGLNRRGLLVACRPGGPVAVAGLAAAALGHAAGADEAEALLLAAASGLDARDVVWLAGVHGGRCLELGPGGAHSRRLAPVAAADGGLAAVRAALRSPGGSGEQGRCPPGTPPPAASALAARLDAAGEPVLLVCLGPPCCGVFLRQWPGIPPPPPLSWSGGRPPLLGTLAAALARATEADPGRLRQVRLALARVEAQALAEGDEAERMARVMDAAGDDHGAEVRRALGQAHAADLAVAAMEALGARRGPLRASL
jgi:hypothetical protein